MSIATTLGQLRSYDAELPIVLDVEGTFFNLGAVSGFINGPDQVLTAAQFVPAVKLNGHLRDALAQDHVDPEGNVQIYMADGDDLGAYWEMKEIRVASPAEAKTLGTSAIIISTGDVICC